jgi:hypothetical protein
VDDEIYKFYLPNFKPTLSGCGDITLQIKNNPDRDLIKFDAKKREFSIYTNNE